MYTDQKQNGFNRVKPAVVLYSLLHDYGTLQLPITIVDLTELPTPQTEIPPNLETMNYIKLCATIPVNMNLGYVDEHCLPRQGPRP